MHPIAPHDRWDGNNQWFTGTIMTVRPRDLQVRINYDDGDRKWHSMWLETYEFIFDEASCARATQRADSVLTRPFPVSLMTGKAQCWHTAYYHEQCG